MHYIAQYATYKAAGLDSKKAFEYAYYSDYTDIDKRYDAIYNSLPVVDRNPEYKEILHQLNGMDPETRKRFRCCLEDLIRQAFKNNDSKSQGVLMHILGDTYGHTEMYMTQDVPFNPQDYYETGGHPPGGSPIDTTETKIIGIGDGQESDNLPNYKGDHTKDWKRPDRMETRPELSKEYLTKTFELAGGTDKAQLQKILDIVDQLPSNASEETAYNKFVELIQRENWYNGLDSEGKEVKYNPSEYGYIDQFLRSNNLYDDLPTIEPGEMQKIIDSVKSNCMNK